MSDLEQRLRDELQKISERADPGSIRPLRVRPARGRKRLARWLAPVAAVAAVLAVIAGVFLVAGWHRSRPPAEAALAGMPRDYVTLVERGEYMPLTATVRSSATGAALTKVDVPQGTQGTYGAAITAAGDGLTFVITQLLNAPAGVTYRFYVLHLAANGRAATLSRLPISIPLPDAAGTAVLSPDGSKLAMTMQFCGRQGCQRSAIEVVTLANGATTTWTGPECPVSSAQTPCYMTNEVLAWDGNERVVFQGSVSATSWSPRFKLLDVTGTGGSLLTSPVVTPATVVNPGARSVFVEPGGRAIVSPVVRVVPHGKPCPRPVPGKITPRRIAACESRYTMTTSVVEQSLATGRPLRVLHTASSRLAGDGPDGRAECQVLGLGSAGIHALVDCTGFGGTGFGRLDGTRFTPLTGLPAPAGTSSQAYYVVTAAW